MRRMCLVACLAAALLAALSGTAAAGTVLSETYPDPIGDSGTGADIGNTTVSASAGVLTFRIEVPNRPTFVSGEQVNLFLNTDGNQLNNNFGADYAIFTTAPSGVVQTRLGKWNASTSVYDTITPPSFSGSFGNGVIQATVSLADLSSLPLIDVDVWSFVPTGVVDTAPDNLGWFPSFDTRDADSDGVSDSKDACPTEAALDFDPNNDGCDGPYDRVGRPIFLHRFLNVTGGLKFTAAELDLVEAGARAVVRAGNRTQTTTKRPNRPLIVRILIGRTLTYGSVITVSITEENEIGWYGQYRVTRNGLKRFSEKCIPPGGGSPRACSAVDPGQ
jgi:hypothetical protein